MRCELTSACDATHTRKCECSCWDVRLYAHVLNQKCISILPPYTRCTDACVWQLESWCLPACPAAWLCLVYPKVMRQKTVLMLCELCVVHGVVCSMYVCYACMCMEDFRSPRVSGSVGWTVDNAAGCNDDENDDDSSSSSSSGSIGGTGIVLDGCGCKCRISRVYVWRVVLIVHVMLCSLYALLCAVLLLVRIYA